jgi:hypothetical protein
MVAMQPQTAFRFDLPSPAELTKLTPQEKTLYARLLVGGIRIDDIRKETGLIHYSRRFTSIRRALAEHGWKLSKRHCGNRINEYFLEQIKQEAA